jgi:tetratricopeptide (TPR) repeat protein
MLRFFIVALWLLCANWVFAQKSLELAEQYFDMQDYAKAAETYEKSLKTPEQFAQYHNNYLSCLLKIGNEKALEKYFKKILKDKPLYARYNVDYGKFLKQFGQSQKAQEHYKQYLNAIKADIGTLQLAAAEFSKIPEYEWAEQALLTAKPYSETSVSYDLAALYFNWGKVPQAIENYLFILTKDQSRTEYIQSQLSAYIAQESQASILEKKLIEFSQKDTDLIFSDMLIWFYLQKRDFYSAFVQARSYDKRRGFPGEKVMEIAQIAIENKSYQQAREMLEYVIDKHKKSRNYATARQMLIQIKESILENKYPVDSKEVASLTADYQALIDELGIHPFTAESVMGLAKLSAFYQRNYDSAISILRLLTQNRNIPQKVVNEAKLLLGDIYLLMGDFGEAGLTYMQVEAAEKDQDLGHLAKFKDAKLFYYEGQFELARTTLNVLKQATSRQISNDAIELAHIIQVNYDMDTTEEAMKEFVQAELLVFQRRLPEALARFENMLEKFKNHLLTDDILWKSSQILLTMGKTEAAISQLEKIVTEFASETWGDDANFLLGVIYEEKLQDKEKAMKIYEKQLIDFQGSTYNVEARKRFRRLRGDKIN